MTVMLSFTLVYDRYICFYQCGNISTQCYSLTALCHTYDNYMFIFVDKVLLIIFHITSDHVIAANFL